MFQADALSNVLEAEAHRDGVRSWEKGGIKGPIYPQKALSMVKWQDTGDTTGNNQADE